MAASCPSARRRAAIEMKLADIQDTIDACRTGADDVLIGQFRDRYAPSRLMLEASPHPMA